MISAATMFDSTKQELTEQNSSSAELRAHESAGEVHRPYHDILPEA